MATHHLSDDVVGQQHMTAALKAQVQTRRLSHAYLFTGTRGTGKTTCAKILARAANCLSPVDGNPCNQCENCRAVLEDAAMDVSEIDAASNNGVDNIREIREEVNYAPTALRLRTYIIDEVHMLSPGAFNALLKTLEEPPEHALFILATTEIHKVPATILSRCQRYDFRRISPAAIGDRLLTIARAETLSLSPRPLCFWPGWATAPCGMPSPFWTVVWPGIPPSICIMCKVVWEWRKTSSFYPSFPPCAKKTPPRP